MSEWVVVDLALWLDGSREYGEQERESWCKERSFVPKIVLKELSNGRLGTSEATLAPNRVKLVLPIWP